MGNKSKVIKIFLRDRSGMSFIVVQFEFWSHVQVIQTFIWNGYEYSDIRHSGEQGQRLSDKICAIVLKGSNNFILLEKDKTWDQYADQNSVLKKQDE